MTSLERFHVVLKVIAKNKVIGEEPTVILTEAMEVLVVRLHPDEVAGSVFRLPTGSVQLPDDLKASLSGVGAFVDIEVL